MCMMTMNMKTLHRAQRKNQSLTFFERIELFVFKKVAGDRRSTLLWTWCSHRTPQPKTNRTAVAARIGKRIA